MQATEDQPIINTTPRVFTGHPVREKRATVSKPVQITLPLWVGLLGAALLGLVLRAAFLDKQSAYMDETSYILTGRLLIEKHVSYLGSANWTYGSYLWGYLTGLTDMLGGLTLVRGLTALLGAVMVVATGLTAYRFTSDSLTPTRRWLVAVVAALIMAVFPTALGVGRFATYDVPAGAAFMLGMSLLAPFPVKPKRGTLLVAAGLMLLAFLSKYVVAIYFPFLCLFLLFGRRSPATFKRTAIFFVLPLAIGCAAYFLLFQTELFNLLKYAKDYTDLKSDNPWREYVWQRPELWVLAAIALLGSRRASLTLKVVAWVGVATILAFQAISRPDFDFWKHSIYVVFFLAPLAALVIAPVVEFLLRWVGPARWKQPGRGLAIVLTAFLTLIATAALYFALQAGDNLVTFYPNLNPSVDAIRANTATAKNVLVDDIAVRYYVYPNLQPQQVTDPFFVNYQGKEGMAAYTQAISDRFYDTIILDGGIGPVASQIRGQLDEVISHYYTVTYSNEAGSNAVLEIYRPRTGEIAPLTAQSQSSNGSKTFNFDGSVHAWGGHPDSGNQQPGTQVAISHVQTWQNQASLEFKPTDSDSLVSVKYGAAVRQIKMQVFVVGSSSYDAIPLHVGLVGFDQSWQWHDDGFKQTVPVGKWTELTWNLDQPGVYNEIGLKLKEAAGYKIYIGQVEVQP